MDHRLTSPPSSLGKSELPGPPSLVLWESLSEHRSAALRLPFRRPILNHIPMLDEDSVLNVQNIWGNPVYRKTNTAKSPVYEPGTILAEGDIVIVHGRFSGFGAPANWIAADILRVQNGILVEHWDVIQNEATEEQSISKRPMFGTTFPTYA